MNRYWTPGQEILPEQVPTDIVCRFDGQDRVEQSAIYADVMFEAVGERSPGIVLTPECDISRGKPEDYVILGRIVPVLAIFDWWLLGQEKNPYTEEEVEGKAQIAKGRKRRKNVIEDFAKQYLRNRVFRYFFLPELPTKFPHSFVCCDIVKCISLETLAIEHKKICALNSPFREAVPAHYAAYVGRVGLPEFDLDYLEQILDKGCRLVDP